MSYLTLRVRWCVACAYTKWG